jgi:two-component system phosphate regulon response regulator PhoB
MGEPRARVMVVDDEADLAGLLAFNLRSSGFEVTVFNTGEASIAALDDNEFEVAVLDLMLPGISGLQICRHIRGKPSLADTGVLMLSARGGEFDRVLGFEAGVDDYVTKPYSVREIVLRVKTLAVRAIDRRLARDAPKPGKRYAWGGVEVQTASHTVTIDGAAVTLRPMEFKLLATFLSNPGRAFSRAELLADVWGWDEADDNATRTVDTTVRRLRMALGGYGELVETVHSVGYRSRPPPPAP